MSSWARDVIRRTEQAFSDQHNPIRAAGAAKYMKFVAPFIGIDATTRRQLLRAAWKGMPTPTSDELGTAALQLMKLPEREFHYAAYDLIDTYIKFADEYFLAEYLERLIPMNAWWDTVDGLVTAGVSPLCYRYDAEALMKEWSNSDNIWLIRASIGHQRGWKQDTDVPFVLSICQQHWKNKEFFIAKAIGWALRDITAFDYRAVQQFLNEQTVRNAVAEREAKRGIARAKKK